MATAQDDLLIQAVIALLKADATIAGIVGARIIQGEQPIAGVTTPYVTVDVDFENRILGLPSHRGSLGVYGWHDNSPATNKTVVRSLMAEVRRLIDVEHETSSINDKVSGLKLRFCAQLNAPLLEDDQSNLFYSPSIYEVVFDT